MQAVAARSGDRSDAPAITFRSFRARMGEGRLVAAQRNQRKLINGCMREVVCELISTSQQSSLSLCFNWLVTQMQWNMHMVCINKLKLVFCEQPITPAPSCWRLKRRQEKKLKLKYSAKLFHLLPHLCPQDSALTEVSLTYISLRSYEELALEKSNRRTFRFYHEVLTWNLAERTYFLRRVTHLYLNIIY